MPGLGDLLRGLFGGGRAAAAEPETAGPAEDYKGFSIQPASRRNGGQWTTEAVISKTVGDAVKEHRLIRADLFADPDDAASASIAKAKRMIDEQGEKLFGGG